ncbi:MULTISPECIES: barstar family protein [Aerococcus]|uniref:Barstar family protein n=1 Tax=Aerococcus sanguinicola TaxID=119206 RepID=A0A5N1GPZ3_9LACT|nr:MULTISPECIES: barstar family protein [Aerococcus]KAA9302454.1 barstar family protein [Aerococcus sanguinicola]MDK6369829.1 barstar family protein [Aerococcus sp. UMB9870]MDK6680469.1 barstar family protein [Aerococcus sp. UMB8608]MDK6687034.1 barstar family protein [Aerococcus sp. UMB8623]MDK6940253.1 barstar family protein [Aerococcus sp. UMB8487]
MKEQAQKSIIHIDGRQLSNSAEAYAYLYQEILQGRPSHAAYNLDALYDVLSQLPPDQKIVLSHYSDLQAREKRWARRLRRVFSEAARDWGLDLIWEEIDDGKH